MSDHWLPCLSNRPLADVHISFFFPTIMLPTFLSAFVTLGYEARLVFYAASLMVLISMPVNLEVIIHGHLCFNVKLFSKRIFCVGNRIKTFLISKSIMCLES